MVSSKEEVLKSLVAHFKHAGRERAERGRHKHEEKHINHANVHTCMLKKFTFPISIFRRDSINSDTKGAFSLTVNFENRKKKLDFSQIHVHHVRYVA